MFNLIRNDPVLFGATRGTCSENDVGITFADGLLDPNGEIDDEKVLIIKVDYLYSAAFMDNPPKAIDCLIIVRCANGQHFDIYLIELRNVKRPRDAHPQEITEKFRTVVDDLFTRRFAHVFSQLEPRIRQLRSYLVTDPYRVAGKQLTEPQQKELYLGTVLDAYGSIDPFKFGRHAIAIEVKLPNPVIASC